MTYQSTILLKLNGIMNSLTPREKKVAEYILKRPEDVIHFSITEFAENASISESTIYRLVRRLKFTGYQEFKIELAKELASPLINVNEEIGPEDSIKEIANKVINSNIESLKNTLQILNPKELEKVTEIIMNSKRIVTFGVGSSGVIAQEAANKFIRLGFAASAYNDTHMQIIVASLLKEGDVVIGISHSGNLKDIIRALEVAKEAGATTICITNNINSPITKVSHHKLYTAVPQELSYGDVLSSRIAELTIIDVLYTIIAIKNLEESKEKVKKIEEALEEEKLHP